MAAMYLLAAFAAVVASAIAGAPTPKQYVAPTYAPSYQKPSSGYPHPAASPYVPAPGYDKPTATYQQPASAYNAQPHYPSHPDPYFPSMYGGSTGNQYGGNTYNDNYANSDNYAGHAFKEDKLDEVDELFAILEDTMADLQIANEQFTKVQSQLGINKRDRDELEIILIPALALVSEGQNKELDRLVYDLHELKEELRRLDDMITSVENQNANNTEDQDEVNRLVTAAESFNNLQSGLISELLKAVEDFKTTSLTILKNEFANFAIGAQQQGRLLASVIDYRNSRNCENGVVTLNRMDLRATVNFQTKFGENIPNVFFGIVGYEFDTDVRKNKHPVSYSNTAYTKPDIYGNYGSYGNTGNYGNTGSYGKTGNYGGYGSAGSYGGDYHKFQEPNDLGVFVRALTSPDSLTFTAVDGSFADIALKSVTVSWQACYIGPEYQAVLN